MPVKTKTFYKSPLFWGISAGGVLVIALVTVLILFLTSPRPADPVVAPTQPSQTPTLPANPFGQDDFAYRGDYLACLTAPSVLGVDVSEWQEQIDWNQVKAAGVKFVMIRGGWRGYETGDLTADTQAQNYYEGATAAGLRVGAYFFSQAISPEEAVAEADFLLNVMKDWQVEMPVVFDWEFVSAEARTGNVDARTLTDCAKAFCNRVKSAGYAPMVYFNTTQSLEGMYLEELTDYGFWLARYDTVLDYPHKVDMWQYTEAGAVPGISGEVDINLYFPWEEP